MEYAPSMYLRPVYAPVSFNTAGMRQAAEAFGLTDPDEIEAWINAKFDEIRQAYENLTSEDFIFIADKETQELLAPLIYQGDKCILPVCFNFRGWGEYAMQKFAGDAFHARPYVEAKFAEAMAYVDSLRVGESIVCGPIPFLLEPVEPARRAVWEWRFSPPAVCPDCVPAKPAPPYILVDGDTGAGPVTILPMGEEQ